MPLFKVTTRDTTGARKTLEIDAATEREAVASVRSRGMVVLSVELMQAAGGEASPSRGHPHWHPAWLLPMTSFDAELGFYQLASMLRSGVSILQGLDTVAAQARRPRAAVIWRSVHDQLCSGEGFSDALAIHRRVFGTIGIELIRVGEHSGELDIALSRAAEEMEGRRSLRMMVANALVYPLLATVMALAVSTYLVVAVIPKITDFLESGGVTLPPMTQFLMDLSFWMRANGLHVLIGIIAFLAIVFLARLSKSGRELEDRILLRLPVVGRILRLSGTALFARAMNMLVESGVTLLDALDVTRQLMGNLRLARRIEEAHEAVMRGSSLADSLLAATEFMPMLSRMTAVGETTGALGEAFSEVARFHERMLEVTIKRFSVTIEPVMIVVTALIVSFVYLSFFMALFSMAGVD